MDRKFTDDLDRSISSLILAVLVRISVLYLFSLQVDYSQDEVCLLACSSDQLQQRVALEGAHFMFHCSPTILALVCITM